MKGQRKLNLNGKDLLIRFSFGAVEDFCEELDIKFSQWEQEVFDSPKNLRIFIYHSAKENLKDLKPEQLRNLDFFEAMGKVASLIHEATDNIDEPSGNAPKGKKKK